MPDCLAARLPASSYFPDLSRIEIPSPPTDKLLIGVEGHMLLQGSLQVVFDVLHNLGVIDPVLEMDWTIAQRDFTEHVDELEKVLQVANNFQNDPQQLQVELSRFDARTLEYLAMEVAREFASFHARDALH